VIGNRSLPSAPPGCLERAYPSSQKGGTIVVEWVCDLETHEELLCEPERYRPETCGRCALAATPTSPTCGRVKVLHPAYDGTVGC
jgi:hypothetical protein